MPYSTQKQLVLNYLKDHGSISSWVAIQELRVTRLAEYIRSLRHDDLLTITDEWKENNKKRFKVYFLEVKVEMPLKEIRQGKQYQ